MTGIGAVVRSLTEQAIRTGLQAVWIVPDGPGELFFGTPGQTELHEVRATNRAHGRDLALAWGTAKELLRLRHEIDLIHAHQPHLQTLASIFVARLRGWPAVVTLHGRLQRPDDPIRRLMLEWIERRTFAWANAVVLVSADSARRFGDDRSRLILNGVPTYRGTLSGDRREAVRAAWECGDLPVILFAGRFSRLKGIFDLLDAAQVLAQEGLAFRLVLIGNGSADEERLLRERIEASGLKGRARVYGASNRYQEVLEAADIFVLPSYVEGLPIGLLEAMASGLPIVATHVGGIPEAIRDGIEGTLVSPGDIRAIRDAIAWMLTHPQERAIMGTHAADRARASFSEEQMTSAYLKLYGELARSDASPYTVQNRSA
ncbi:MAG TPA: glycosyltransferase family 4 protein [Thermoplasmata archaeon]|nr:glycosyltransferase family 4 protein [Thermoplasmata archaeon]